MAHLKDQSSKNDLLRGAHRRRGAPDHSQGQQALLDKLEVLEDGLKALGVPRWAACLDPEPVADKAWRWGKLKRRHLKRWGKARWVEPVATTACLSLAEQTSVQCTV